MRTLNIYNPSVFQGNLKKKNYFEGWYFKVVSEDLSHVFSFIPGVSLNEEDPHCFIQIIDGITGTSEYLSYPVSEFSWKKEQFYIRINNSVFSEEYISPDIRGKIFNINGRIDFSNLVKYPKRLLSPGIMGWYSFVPTMECKHGIVSVNHDLTGKLTVNGSNVGLDNGKGYSEKDWGTSFPEAWLWIQANNFNDHGTSFCFSVAKIPWRGKFFIGFIAFLYYAGRFHLFSTYNNSIIREIEHSGNEISLVLENRKNILKVITSKKLDGELKAPVLGVMSRRIKETIDASVNLVLYNSDNEIIYTDSSKRAGMELIEKIFEYLR